MSEVRFDSVYSFIYSPRRGTPAAEMENAVPDDVAGVRFRRLLAVQSEISLEKNTKMVGKTLRVLVDGPSKGDASVMSGRTDGGKLVHFPRGKEREGDFALVRIERAEPYALYGTVEE